MKYLKKQHEKSFSIVSKMPILGKKTGVLGVQLTKDQSLFV